MRNYVDRASLSCTMEGKDLKAGNQLPHIYQSLVFITQSSMHFYGLRSNHLISHILYKIIEKRERNISSYTKFEFWNLVRST